MKNTGNFHSFLVSTIVETNTVDKVSTELRKSLGSQLSKVGWRDGTAGTGIVSIINKDDNSFNKARTLINNFLKNNAYSSDVLQRGSLSGELIAEYKNQLISLVKTEDSIKLLVS